MPPQPPIHAGKGSLQVPISRDVNLTSNLQLVPRLSMNINVRVCQLLLYYLMACARNVCTFYIWTVELLVFFHAWAENISSPSDEMTSKMLCAASLALLLV